MQLADDTVLVVGTGYLGQRFLQQAPENSAVGLSRTAVSWAGPTAVLDLDANAVLPVSLAKQYHVLYTVPPAPQSESDPRLERLLFMLDPTPASFVYISTTGVYGDRGGDTVDEQVEARATTAWAKRRVAAEQVLQSWANEQNVRLCILRTPGIYGPGRLGVGQLREATPLIEEADANPGNRIHVDDLVTCCAAALGNAEFSGLCNVGDGDFRSATWFAIEVARQCGLPSPPTISRAAAENQFSTRRLAIFGESRRLDTRRMQDELGVTPRYANAEDGIRVSLEEEYR